MPGGAGGHGVEREWRGCRRRAGDAGPTGPFLHHGAALRRAAEWAGRFERECPPARCTGWGTSVRGQDARPRVGGRVDLMDGVPPGGAPTGRTGALAWRGTQPKVACQVAGPTMPST
ncbi:hypothetical protein FRACA_1330006 [Frankia canadensis]|uniref:Uncharacterized protein n=1 Tax=Frankia canadensis TaxID=1836972 RepID=A0A2I2KKX1_9ACTN|nr:hypothetical protein FRACA_1330006 [Frankia canadensis]SOU53577.1 hypothetical protein FRACA_1330006 [Frankia canadensis]